MPSVIVGLVMAALDRPHLYQELLLLTQVVAVVVPLERLPMQLVAQAAAVQGVPI